MSIIKPISICICIVLLFGGCKKYADKENKLCNRISNIVPDIRIYEEVGQKTFLTDTILDGSLAVLDANLMLDEQSFFSPFTSIEWNVGGNMFYHVPKLRLRFPVGGDAEIPVQVKLKYDPELLPCRKDTHTVTITKMLVVKPITQSRIIGAYTGINQGENEPPFIVSIKGEYRNNAFYGYWIKNINKGCYQGPIPPSQEEIKPGVQMVAGYNSAIFYESGKNYGCVNVSGSLVLQGNTIIIDYQYANELEYGTSSNPTYYYKKFVGTKN
jgi:hypothetical protein